MRVRSRWVLGFCGLAMAGPAASTASAQVGQPYPIAPTVAAPSPGGAPVITLQQSSGPQPMIGAMPPAMAAPAAPSGAPPAPHHHHGLLARRHCVECQRAHAKAVDGVDVPPPPGYPGAPGMAAAGTVVSGPVLVREYYVGAGAPNAPGYAVVGGPETAPGMAVVNGGEQPGAEPTPIGVARSGLNAQADPRMAAAMRRPGAGSYDPAVMPTSVPPPPTPMAGPGHNRPHVISHVLGLPILGKHHEERVEKRRERHSAVAYGDPNEKVTELPASMVYGRK
jgi:hypothetical protein